LNALGAISKSHSGPLRLQKTTKVGKTAQEKKKRHRTYIKHIL